MENNLGPLDIKVCVDGDDIGSKMFPMQRIVLKDSLDFVGFNFFFSISSNSWHQRPIDRKICLGLCPANSEQ